MWREVVTLVQRTTWDMWPRERDSFRGRHITSFWWRGGGGGRGREGGREVGEGKVALGVLQVVYFTTTNILINVQHMTNMPNTILSHGHNP